MNQTIFSPQPKKPFADSDLVCYCFRYTRKDIETDLTLNGRSTILERIVSEKKAGACDCRNQNPSGR
jgi:hypothetical protein